MEQALPAYMARYGLTMGQELEYDEYGNLGHRIVSKPDDPWVYPKNGSMGRYDLKLRGAFREKMAVTVERSRYVAGEDYTVRWTGTKTLRRTIDGGDMVTETPIALTPVVLKVSELEEQRARYYEAFPAAKNRCVKATGKSGLVKQDLMNEVVRLFCISNYRNVGALERSRCTLGCEDDWPEALRTTTDTMEEIDEADVSAVQGQLDPATSAAMSLLSEI